MLDYSVSPGQPALTTYKAGRCRFKVLSISHQAGLDNVLQGMLRVKKADSAVRVSIALF